MQEAIATEAVGKPRVQCQACGILFVPKPCTLGKYCDRACKNRSQVKMKTVKCAGCGKPLRRHASELRRNRSSACNRKCQAAGVAIPWDKVAELRRSGMSYRKIGKALGCGRTKVERIFKAQ